MCINDLNQVSDSKIQIYKQIKPLLEENFKLIDRMYRKDYYNPFSDKISVGSMVQLKSFTIINKQNKDIGGHVIPTKYIVIEIDLNNKCTLSDMDGNILEEKFEIHHLKLKRDHVSQSIFNGIVNGSFKKNNEKGN